MIAPELERPTCACHGEPMVRMGQRHGRPQWACRPTQRERSRLCNERRRRAAGIPPRQPGRSPAEYRERENELARARYARLREHDPEGYAARRAAVNASRRRWYANLSDEQRAEHFANVYAWQQTPTGKARKAATGQRRRAIKAGASSTFDAARDREALLAEYGDRCAYCGAGGPLELDHDVPIVRGGDHVWRNIVPACRSCNASKHARTGFEYELVRLEERANAWRRATT